VTFKFQFFPALSRTCTNPEIFKIADIFQDLKPRKHAEKVLLKSSKIQQLPETSNVSVLFVLYLQQCHSTSMFFSFQGPQLDHKCDIPKCNSTC